MNNQSSRMQQRYIAESGKTHPHICLLGADYENSNLGIRALTTGALTAIYAQYPNARVWMLEYAVAPNRFIFDLPIKTVSVEMLNIRFSKKLLLKNHVARLIATAILAKLIPQRTFRRKLLSHNPWLQMLLDTDYILSLNYGDSFSDIYGMKRFFYVSLPQVLALLLKKPLVQLPQTIGPFKSLMCRTIAKWILSRSALVYTRDEEAIPDIRTLVPVSRAGRVRFCNDLGFVVPPKDFTPHDPPLDRVFEHRPVVGFNVSGLLWMGGYTRENMFGLVSDYKILVRKAIVEFIEEKGVNVLLVPHVLSSTGEGDPSACDEIFSELKQVYSDHIFTLKTPYNEREVKHVIARCDFFVGSRMHACIAALSQCVPTAAMAYSGKFIGVLRSVGMASSVADLRSLSSDEVLSVLLTSFDSREVIKLMLHKEIAAVKKTIGGLLNEHDIELQQLLANAKAARKNIKYA